MIRQAQLMEISEVRALVTQVVREHPVPHRVVHAARDTLQAMCDEAAQYGLTTADVVKALLYPVFEKKRSCDCPTCKDRRRNAEEEQLQRWQTWPLQGLGQAESMSQ